MDNSGSNVWDMFSPEELQGITAGPPPQIRSAVPRKSIYQTSQREKRDNQGEPLNQRAIQARNIIDKKFPKAEGSIPMAFELLLNKRLTPLTAVIKLAKKYLPSYMSDYVDDYIKEGTREHTPDAAMFKSMFMNQLPKSISNPAINVGTAREFLDYKYRKYGGIASVLDKREEAISKGKNESNNASAAFKEAYRAMPNGKPISAYGEATGSMIMDIHRKENAMKIPSMYINFNSPNHIQRQPIPKSTKHNLDEDIYLRAYNSGEVGVDNALGYYNPSYHSLSLNMDPLKTGRGDVQDTYNHEMSHAIGYSLPHQLHNVLREDYNSHHNYHPHEIEATIMEGHSRWMLNGGGRPIIEKKDADDFYKWILDSDWLKRQGYGDAVKEFLESDAAKAKIFLQSIVKNDKKEEKIYG